MFPVSPGISTPSRSHWTESGVPVIDKLSVPRFPSQIKYGFSGAETVPDTTQMAFAEITAKLAAAVRIKVLSLFISFGFLVNE